MEEKISAQELVKSCIRELDNISVPTALTQQISVPIIRVTGMLRALDDFFTRHANKQEEKVEKKDGTV